MATLVSAPPRLALRLAPVRLWHLCSLDAPCVAALWAAYLAWQFRVSLPFAAPVALALAVWLLYAWDRVNDAAHGRTEAERHRFHYRHRFRFLAGSAVVASALAALLFELPPVLRSAWLALGLPMAAYAVAVHGFGLRVPKEPLVASFFAAATAVPVVAHGGPHGVSLVSVAFCFGALCWLNCAAIARWERLPAWADPLTDWLQHHLRGGLCIGALLSLWLLSQRGTAAVGLASLLACACLYALDQLRAGLEPVTLRALADAALLTPLLSWPVAVRLHLR